MRRFFSLVLILAVMAAAGVGVAMWKTRQTRVAREQEQAAEAVRKQEAEREAEKKKKEIKTKYKIGDEVDASVIIRQGDLIYHGKVVDTYPEVRTVLMEDGNWGGVHEFSYTEVVDIETDSWTYEYGEIESGPVSLRIRAVLTKSGDLIGLRDLENDQQGEFAYTYTIVEPNKAGGVRQENFYHPVYDEACLSIPKYIYEFLVEHGYDNLCM